MPRYFTRPKAYDDWYSSDISPPSNFTVSDHEPTDTGLLDEHGDTIWRAANPMGFGRDNEWGA